MSEQGYTDFNRTIINIDGDLSLSEKADIAKNIVKANKTISKAKHGGGGRKK